ncbi:class I SAM-dependent methyltransferase [Pseudomonas gingeri]|uniref:Class I SAM-dependent methyltransferase n=1 Tax=Pseudomonas gingeri TaxID=117681 RepID=A0A7Y7WK14_9PSED|nr:class I SAM-dependent methyltransferase [Pseudomonas gingeri]NWB50213.1 class I SAM-dependent methyltransferase [Pseudomonas gingeri]
MARVTDKEFNAALPVMQKLLWADPQDRARLQEQGLNVAPSNFYSSTPSLSEIASSYEYTESEPPYLNCGLFDQERLRAEISELIPYGADFAPAEVGDKETATSYFWKNGQFTCSDAVAYYAYIRRIRPKTIVEIGSGFSSLIAVEALRKNGSGTLHCIEPFPRPFITTLASEGALELQSMRAQELTVEWLNATLEDGDILFIDSTHTVKTGSDCLHIYLRLLPKITKKIFVHVHDVFLPFGLPTHWLIEHQIYWTEQYLLLALMTDNPRTKLLFGSAYHQHFNHDLLTALMHGQSESRGASFWFEFDGRSNV